MVKNNYLLPLILDLIDSIGKKKVFMKMDLHWGYNNVSVIVQGCGQTLGLGLVDKNRTVVNY